MKKEVLIAVVSGLVLGLIITFGVYTTNRSLEQQRQKKASEQETSNQPATSSSTVNKKLSIISHENYDLVNQSEIILTGIAWPGAVIAIITEADEFLILGDDQGNFTINLKLIKGFNEIKVIATDETKETQQQDLVITYSTHEIKLETETESETEE